MKTGNPDGIEAKPYIGFNRVLMEHLFDTSEKASHINELDRKLLKQVRFDLIYLRMAKEWAKNSCCTRKKVGAIIVNDNKIISDGYNGMPHGLDNWCEDESGETRWETLHAEANALMKLTKSSDSAIGATVYLTFSPCRECAKLMHQAGISRLVFNATHSNVEGLHLLNSVGVDIWRYPYVEFDNFLKLNEMINER